MNAGKERHRFGVCDSVLAEAKRMRQDAALPGQVIISFSGERPTGSWLRSLPRAERDLLPIVFVQRDEPESKVQADANSRNGSAGLSREQESGMPVIPVDANDAIAIYRVAQESIRHARQGGGPTLIRCQSYRIEAPSRTSIVRECEEEQDALSKLEGHLAAQGIVTRNLRKRVLREFSATFAVLAQASNQDGLLHLA
jgi:TPP-dependent pyruvate/acetoin dehydrogenase alpha subunit